MDEVFYTRDPVATRERLVSAAVDLILRQGFSATSVDQICAKAGVTKGGFFHHFKNKDAVGVAAAQSWFDLVTEGYSKALLRAGSDPLDQLHAFFSALEDFTRTPDRLCACVIGMLSQELALVHPELRTVAGNHFVAWTACLKNLLLTAKDKHPPVIDFDPEQVAWFINCLWQGSIVVAKSVPSVSLFQSNLQLAREWIDRLFGTASPQSNPIGARIS